MCEVGDGDATWPVMAELWRLVNEVSKEVGMLAGEHHMKCVLFSRGLVKLYTACGATVDEVPKEAGCKLTGVMSGIGVVCLAPGCW